MCAWKKTDERKQTKLIFAKEISACIKFPIEFFLFFSLTSCIHQNSCLSSTHIRLFFFAKSDTDQSLLFVVVYKNLRLFFDVVDVVETYRGRRRLNFFPLCVNNNKKKQEESSHFVVKMLKFVFIFLLFSLVLTKTSSK